MTRNPGHSGGRRAGGWARRMLQGAALLAVAASVPAAWSAGGVQINNVAAGQAAMAQAGNVTTIRTYSQSTIINFQRMDVAAGETLQFLQPNAHSRVLDRIQSDMPTTIDGTLLSNGRVYIVNPAGVMFGNGAVVNVGALYASAGHISDGNFMNGINLFTGNTGVVRNQGVIQAGEIHLVGGSVANFGQIVTYGDGIVTLTAGKDVYIAESESPTGQTSILVKVSSDQTTAKAGTAVSNSGTVSAGAGGAIYMGAGDLYAAGIYNNGTLRGKDIKLSAGANTNVNQGKIDARSATGKGGTVEMTGAKVGVFSGTVDASGATGGGTVKIGGDFHGAAGTPASDVTVVGSSATIKADAIGTGDGGQVAVWSNGDTVFTGAISARGGLLGGNGGYVEVSGKQNLAFAGAVDVGATLGAPGTILMDPGTITIGSSGPDDGTLGGSFNTTANHNYQFAATAVSNLVGSVILTSSGDINVNASVSVNTNVSTFTLNATTSAANITFTPGVQIVAAGTASILLNAGQNINLANNTGSDNVNSAIRTGAGSIALSAGGTIILDADNNKISAAQLVSGSGAIILQGGEIDLNAGSGAGASIRSSGGSIALQATSGGGTGDINFVLLGNSAAPQITSGGGNIFLQAARTLSLTSGTTPTTISATGSGTGGNILLSAGDTSLGGTSGNIFMGHDAQVLTNGGTITLRLTALDLNNTGQAINAGATSTSTVAFETNNPANTIGVGSATGSLLLSNSLLTATVTTTNLRIGANGTQAGAVTLQQVALGSTNLEVNANGTGSGAAIAVNDNNNSTGVSLTGNLTLRAGAGGITTTQTTNGHADVLLLGGGHTLTMVSAGGIGGSSSRFEIGSLTAGAISIASTGTQGVFITGLAGALNFASLSNPGGVTDVIAAGDIDGNTSGGISGAKVLLNAGGRHGGRVHLHNRRGADGYHRRAG